MKTVSMTSVVITIKFMFLLCASVQVVAENMEDERELFMYSTYSSFVPQQQQQYQYPYYSHFPQDYQYPMYDQYSYVPPSTAGFGGSGYYYDDVPPTPPKKCFTSNSCKCKSYFKVEPSLLNFFDHVINAQREGCFLATPSNLADLEQLLALGVQESQSITTLPDFEFMYFGLFRPQVFTGESAIDGSPNGPWRWIDGCTPYSFSPFDLMQPDNIGGDEHVGAFTLTFTLTGNSTNPGNSTIPPGSVVDISSDALLPAVYECCRQPGKKAPKNKRLTPLPEACVDQLSLLDLGMNMDLAGAETAVAAFNDMRAISAGDRCTLAPINDEQDVLDASALATGDGCWVGIRNVLPRVMPLTAGWTNPDGSAVPDDDMLWNAGQPTNAGGSQTAATVNDSEGPLLTDRDATNTAFSCAIISCCNF